MVKSPFSTKINIIFIIPQNHAKGNRISKIPSTIPKDFAISKNYPSSFSFSVENFDKLCYNKTVDTIPNRSDIFDCEEFHLKQVYILLSRTQTLPSRLIHGMTGGTFTHTSLALIPQTDSFYSYARRTLHNPFNAGMIAENIHTFVFARYPDCHCALYEIEVSDEGYEKMKRLVEEYLKNYKKAKYNFLGTLPLRLGLRMRRRWKLVCSQFVAIALQESGDVTLPKDPYLMLPNDFPKMKGARKIYEGILKDCNFSEASSLSGVPCP